MEQRIQVLPVDVANKIAAGEVVERPASVVKELVENAIDAGATSIQIEIDQGGLERILVIDNGSGMSALDAPRALERHATSKIRDEADLFSIATLGFRGEALPSIASVSKFRLLTRREEDLAGTLVKVENGLTTVEESAAPKGTRITVENLFYNTPARLKFMKSTVTEGSHVLQVCMHLALTRPEISFQCTRDDKLVLDTSGDANLLSVIHSLYGRAMKEQLLPVQYADGEYTVTGWVGKATFSRPSRRDSHFIINGRYATATSIQHAVEEAYRQRMEPRKYPFFVLSLQVPLPLIDVNVHPAKTEVRFQEDRRVYALVQKAVMQALNPVISEDVALKAPPKIEWSVQTNPWKYQVVQETFYHDARPIKNDPEPETPPQPIPSKFPDSAFYVSTSEPNQFPPLRPVSQLAGTYILAQSSDSLWIFDQHAMAERILFHQLKRQFNQGQIQRQMLLEPTTLHYGVAEYDRILQRIPDFSALGFLIEDFGNQTLLVREIPQVLVSMQDQEHYRRLFLELAQTERVPQQSDLLLKRLVTLSCKGSVKANSWLPQQQMMDLIDQLGRCEDASTCPHGRPTYYKIGLGDLDRYFNRVTP